jgi:plastocyanin
MMSLKKRIIQNLVELFLLVVVTGLFMSLAAGCSKDKSPTGPSGGSNSVTMQNNTFSPQSLTVNAGTTVTWTNKDGHDHTVTSTTGAFNSGNIAANGIYSYIFNTAGTYPYHCTIHSSMTGTVIVQSSGGGGGGY